MSDRMILIVILLCAVLAVVVGYCRERRGFERNPVKVESDNL